MPARTERWHRVKELFDAAVDLAPEERATLLDRACSGDQALRVEVESLLESDDQADGFIEQPIFPLPHDLFPETADDSFVDRQFGAYRAIREIGRGGLGAVYLAARSDDEYRKEVAIKVIRRGLDTEDILQRFRNERQILAQLDHPNIARLIDGGTTNDGLPYFVMEYVAGEPIDTYCDKQSLTTAARLDLFRKVCAAVTYAHQNLVIHRDLKPSNILVTSNGEPKLLDFGIAKLLAAEDELYTLTKPSLRVMTPEYASPEQIRGEKITTTSDVYSLGVLLYELLTGQRPYRLKTRSPEEIARAITEQQPERPSTAIAKTSHLEVRTSKLLRGDLDNIVLKAMRKEPARRYASVGQLSEDIRRHLDQLPVIARKDTWSYRSAKFIRRHKLGVAAAALVGLTLVGGIIATVWQATLATKQAKLAAEQRDRAERRFADVRRLSNALLFDIAPKIERLEGSLEAREALVSRALEYLDSLARESAHDLQLQGELAAAYEKVGDLQGAPRKPNISDFSGAIASYEKAANIRHHLLETTPADLDNLERLAANLTAQSFIRFWISDITGSKRESASALAVYERLLAARPGSLELQIASTEAEVDLASTFYFNEELPKVYPIAQKVLTTLEQLRASHPDNADVLRLLGAAHTTLGMTLSWDNKQQEGEAEMAKAFAINEGLVETHPHDNVLNQNLLHTYLQGSQLYQDSEPDRALGILLKAEQIAQRSVQNDAANTQARQNLAKTYSMLGVVAIQLKKIDQAASYLEKSAATFADLKRIDPKNRTYEHDIGRVLMFLGQTKHQQGRFSEAAESYERAVAIFDSDLTADPNNMFALRKLATVYGYLGDVHRDATQNGDREERQRHLAAAKTNHQRAVDVFLQLQSHSPLNEKDRGYLEEARAAVAKDQELQL